MAKVLICFGTRPEFIKIKSIYDNLIKNSNIDCNLLYIKQHKDIKETFESTYELEIDDIGNNRLNNIVASILVKMEKIPEHDYYIVQGDTATAYAIGLYVFNGKRKLIHIEAGLRSYDLEHPYPEEFYRYSLSKIANIHFCPTENNKDNLLKEGIAENIYVVGNTVIDLVKSYNFTKSYQNIVPITLHRRENWGQIKEYLENIDIVAKKYSHIQFIYFIHMNPMMEKFTENIKYIKIRQPLDHKQFVKILYESLFIISDSGGQQEECSYIGKKIICCREKTERPEALEKYSILCPNPKDIENKINDILINYNVEGSDIFGNGLTYKNICDILIEKVFV